MKIVNLAPHADPAGALVKPKTNLHPRLLVVDDQTLVRQVIVRALLNAGYQLDTAEDGDAALAALQAGTYELLVIDETLPKITGIDLLHKIRAARRALPVIMVSGAFPAEELQRHPWLKSVVVLAKPFSTVELLVLVKEALSGRPEFRDYATFASPTPLAHKRQFLPPSRWGLNE